MQEARTEYAKQSGPKAALIAAAFAIAGATALHAQLPTADTTVPDWLDKISVAASPTRSARSTTASRRGHAGRLATH